MTGGLGLTLLAALGAALVLGALAHRLRLPPMFGYIVAGLVIGPFTPGIVADREQVLELADIGVALLMFSIGLRFRLSELASVGRTVLLGAPLQVAVTMALGTLAALLIGRELIEALFLGAIVSICSSVVLVKVAGDLVENTQYGRVALGWSIVQDLITVLLVVILSALAEDSPQPVVDVTRSTAIALAFVALVVVVGSRILPRLLARVARLGSRELFVVAVALLAIGTASAAAFAGVSVALGAFVAGLALSDSDLAASVLGEVVPLRELFATVFFVSIGVLLQPSVLVDAWPVALMLVALIVLGKALPIAGILIGAGQRPAAAFRSAGLLAQSGEFSFVLATVGLEVGAIGSDTFSLAMGATVISILLAAPTFGVARELGARLESRGVLARPLPDLPSATVDLRRHAVIVGYGTVGRTVARTLTRRSFPWIAVDSDYAVVRSARTNGEPVIYGDAGSFEVLAAAGVDRAGVLVIAIPDALASQLAVDHARRSNHRLETVARAGSQAEAAELRRLGAARVIVPQQEVGAELLRYTLRRFGVSDREIDVMLRHQP